MATVLKSAKDAAKYFTALADKYPDGILIVGSAARGKSTLLKALSEHTSLKVYEGDDFGKSVRRNGKEIWAISWDKIPDDFDVVGGVGDNIDEFPKYWNVSKMCLVLLLAPPERFIAAMKARGEREKHAWTDLFREMGNWTPSRARRHLRQKIVEYRAKLPEFGDRTYTVTTAYWPEYFQETGRAKFRGITGGGTS